MIATSKFSYITISNENISAWIGYLSHELQAINLCFIGDILVRSKDKGTTLGSHWLSDSVNVHCLDKNAVTTLVVDEK
jgi:hypothetical protein